VEKRADNKAKAKGTKAKADLDRPDLVALCAVGAEKAVSGELKGLSLEVTESGFGKVRFRADLAGMYRALMGLRAADRVLLEAARFRADSFDRLFSGAGAVAWEALVPAGLGIRLDKVRCTSSALHSQTGIQSVVHKAVAERLCRRRSLSRLPEGEAAEIRVHMEKDFASILLDLSGDPLFKRGYRHEGGIAPLRESTAAALLLLSGWKRKYPLHDPFCGSGTILAEAFLYALDLAPGIGRDFAVGRLAIADPGLEEKVRAELRAKANAERTIRISGSDADGRALELARANFGRLTDLAGPETRAAVPAVSVSALEKAACPFPLEPAEGKTGDPRGFIVTNPPYGKRLGDRTGARELYRGMAGLARNFPGWKLALICDDPDFEGHFGRKADSCRQILSGNSPAFFFQYGRL